MTAQEYPTHAGLVLKAGDTGRVLMIQRSLQDEDDPNGGLWEWPGGGLEPGDHSTFHGAMREFSEEVGQTVPRAGVLGHTWRSDDGVYQGHVLVIPSEDSLPLHDGRATVNPDNPDGDHHEQSAWWEIDHAKKNPALRPEVRASPWKAIKVAAADDEQAWKVAEDALDLALTRGIDPGSVATDLLQAATPAPGGGAQDPSQDPGLAPQDGQVADDEMGDMPPQVPPGGPAAQQPGQVPPGLPQVQQPPPGQQGPPQSLTQRVDDDPEHALPVAYGQEPEPVLPPRAKAGSLVKRSLRDFSRAEQRQIIDEGADEGVGARNYGSLDLTGTHYLLDEDELGV